MWRKYEPMAYWVTQRNQCMYTYAGLCIPIRNTHIRKKIFFLRIYIYTQIFFGASTGGVIFWIPYMGIIEAVDSLISGLFVQPDTCLTVAEAATAVPGTYTVCVGPTIRRVSTIWVKHHAVA